MSLSVLPHDFHPASGRTTLLAFTIIVATVTYQFWLALIHTNLIRISPTLFAMTEIVILLACVPVMFVNIRPVISLVVVFIASNLILMAIFRGGVDFKAFRDIAIVIIFYWVGSNVGNIRTADRLLAALAMVVASVGLVEWLFVDTYTRFINIFSYYLGLGRLDASAAAITGQRLNLNGIRPDGIGRTILPAIFGNHRISSIFLEPVSLGNFAVILAAWGFSKSKEELRKTIFFVSVAVLLIAYSDSRYGLVMLGLLAIFRIVIVDKGHVGAFLFPFFGVGMVIIVAVLFPEKITQDNFLGRLAWTGEALMEFDAGLLVGWESPVKSYMDMGYAYALSKFGLIMCISLWFVFWLLPIRDIRGIRFRAYIALYIALNLSVSGTSLFALKTAGILWFLMGCCVRWESEASNQRTSIHTGQRFGYGS